MKITRIDHTKSEFKSAQKNTLCLADGRVAQTVHGGASERSIGAQCWGDGDDVDDDDDSDDGNVMCWVALA